MYILFSGSLYKKKTFLTYSIYGSYSSNHLVSGRLHRLKWLRMLRSATVATKLFIVNVDANLFPGTASHLSNLVTVLTPSFILAATVDSKGCLRRSLSGILDSNHDTCSVPCLDIKCNRPESDRIRSKNWKDNVLCLTTVNYFECLYQ